MKSSLPIFACLIAAVIATAPWSLAQVPAAQASSAPVARTARAATAAGEDISGDALLRRVLAAVDAQPSISARLRYKIDLMDRTTVGSGIYVQQGRGPQRLLRLELSLQTRSTASHLWHVSDGSNLWIIEELAGQKRVARIDVARLRRARPRLGGSLPVADGWMALGGLPKLLASLDAAFTFGPVRDSRLDDVRVWTLEGRWEPGRLEDLLPDQKEAIVAGRPADLGKLSPQLPTSVVIHVGHDDFFPYRVEYWRSNQNGGEGTPENRGKLLVVMEFYEVRIGGPIDPGQFVFQPAEDVKPEDRTNEFLEKLGLEDTTPAGAKQKSLPRR